MRFGGEIQATGAIRQVHLSVCARPGVRGCWFWVAMAVYCVLGVVFCFGGYSLGLVFRLIFFFLIFF